MLRIPRLLSQLLALSLAAPAAGAPFTLDSVRHAGLPRAEAPAAPRPFYELSAGRPGYDWTGLPAYIFTEEEDLTVPIVEAIDRTRGTLDVALYNLQTDATVQAMLRASARGVKVRVLFDKAHVLPKAGPQIQAMIDSGVETRMMNGRGGTGAMHCKFAVFDGQLLQTGSANWSGFAQNFSYENIMFTGDADIVQGHAADFEWMWAQAVPATDQEAKPAKPGPIPVDPTRDVVFNGTDLPDYAFSPRGGTEADIIKAIDAARSEAAVAMFTFTSANIMEALKRAAGRGVKVKLMLFTGQKFPFFSAAKAARMDLRFKDGRQEKGQMHNKFAVLDGTLLINGSYNWTVTAETSNTEATIFTTAPAYVSAYKAEFEKLFLTATKK